MSIPRLYRGSAQQGINFKAFSYVDPANPVFSTKYSVGGVNKLNGRMNQSPTGKRIVVDGTTAALNTNAPNYQNVVDIVAAKAAYASGDWILFPGGTTTAQAAWNLNGLAAGPSLTQLSLFGSFDPADKYNDAKINTKMAKLDFSSVANGTNPITATTMKGNICFNALNLYSAPTATSARPLSILSDGNGNNHGILFEWCVFDGINVILDSFISQNTGFGNISITRSGSTATVTLLVANTLMQTGDIFAIQGFNQAEYNIINPGVAITVLDSTHFTYPITGTPTTPGTGNGQYYPPFSRIPDAWCRNDITFRYCGLKFGANGTSTNGTIGNVNVDGSRRVRVEACVDEHGGWIQSATRATTNTAGGPDDRTHGFYFNDYCDDVKFMDHVNGADSSNLKFTGNGYWIQNHVSISCPISWIYAANGDSHGFTAWPTGGVFQAINHLAIESDDINSTDAKPRGWGPYITQTVGASFYKNSYLLNCNNPTSATRNAIQANDNGFTFPQALLVDGNRLNNWNYQNTTSVIGNMTVTFTNNWWDNATSGSNTQISTLPAGTQTKLTNQQALNIHTTLRLAYPNFFGSVSVGGSTAVTLQNMLDYMASNPIPDPNQPLAWANIIQYHFLKVVQ